MDSELHKKRPTAEIAVNGVGHTGNRLKRDKRLDVLPTPGDRRIQIVVRLLENNLDKQIAIAEIARQVNLSTSRLAHLFKAEMELSMQQYVTQLRLAKAKRQLATGFLSVKEVAASVGFSSVARFVTCFKSFVGFTPGQYRKRLSNTAYHRAERRR